MRQEGQVSCRRKVTVLIFLFLQCKSTVIVEVNLLLKRDKKNPPQPTQTPQKHFPSPQTRQSNDYAILVLIYLA